LYIPPPPPVTPVAWFARKMQLVMVGLLELELLIPPPEPAVFPFVMVMPWSTDAADSPLWKEKPRPFCWQSRMHLRGSSLAERTVIALPPKSRSCSK
jgi:hypothetical protein